MTDSVWLRVKLPDADEATVSTVQGILRDAGRRSQDWWDRADWTITTTRGESLLMETTLRTGFADTAGDAR